MHFHIAEKNILPEMVKIVKKKASFYLNFVSAYPFLNDSQFLLKLSVAQKR